MAERLGLTYEVLTDHGLAVARSYGLVFRLPGHLGELYDKLGHPPAALQQRGRRQPADPGHLRDRQGRLSEVLPRDPNYMYRASPADVIATLRELA
ncbi:hypothetical protein [Streptomyces sp. OE57]|uniref:hypothetical protein n=1 Tax=Streptomyces lacaronensis TaxID=3379885 RepID=UPI0039B727B1